ncbi:MAG: hypothetical protein KC656_33990, partial [Myxococcales bacterium]|nr:hypothetical protein [Myxococcales bacterium]
MGFFDAIRQWFQGSSTTWEGEDAPMAEEPPVRFDDGEPTHGQSAAEVFERFCRLSLCTHVEAMDARNLLGSSDSALAVVTTTLNRYPDAAYAWAVVRSEGQKGKADPEIWELREQVAIALGWALAFATPLVGDPSGELATVMRTDWSDDLGIVERASLIDGLERA